MECKSVNAIKLGLQLICIVQIQLYIKTHSLTLWLYTLSTYIITSLDYDWQKGETLFSTTHCSLRPTPGPDTVSQYSLLCLRHRTRPQPPLWPHLIYISHGSLWHLCLCSNVLKSHHYSHYSDMDTIYIGECPIQVPPNQIPGH